MPVRSEPASNFGFSHLISSTTNMIARAVLSNHYHRDHPTERVIPERDPATTKAWMVGSGIGCLASAAFLIRDAGVPGENITIFEEFGVHGGSLDGSGSAEDPRGYVIRGGRMLNLSYLCLYDLCKWVPAYEPYFKEKVSNGEEIKTVYDEIMDFDERIKTEAHARLVDAEGNKLDVTSMGFDNQDRLDMLAMLSISEEELGTKRIEECFSEHYFTTNFWYMWQTTFAFKPCHSAVEFKRYLHRFAHEFPRIETLAGVDRTVYNQYDSIVLPLMNHLKSLGVQFVPLTKVVDFEYDRSVPHTMTVKALKLIKTDSGEEETLEIDSVNDLVFFTNGSMTSSAGLGDMDTPAPIKLEPDGTFQLWENVSREFPTLAGNPHNFLNRFEEAQWMSFTVTLRDPTFLRLNEMWTTNSPGTGALVTFKDSKWRLSYVIAKQPHFRNQPDDVAVFWAYALHTDVEGDYVAKPMRECTGREMFEELLGHLKAPFESVGATEHDWETIRDTTVVVPCMMPYITSMFLTRTHEDRPPVVPHGSTNLAFVSQFAEIPDDVVFTVEYSTRAARLAVCELMSLDESKLPPPIYKAGHSPAYLVQSLKSFMS
ncbi:hypothetical protein AMAG_16452 [Allomyces macrogynus ATCC 38327]|uniref:Myosin-crossreactive antigen n=1 Tax=Allomyces macrogynus (strain ATCC 38327) TaxID=578462 RepID=A0A0L0TDN5_ALLM3|nr:hypothetical protein AMAG_16452 [Allomyces macrogynus ATCC 38327]|eukprot:KNE72694.1 hypothetical protein AMAG_16452 [Allomyces macrogynus ATCC 38327]